MPRYTGPNPTSYKVLAKHYRRSLEYTRRQLANLYIAGHGHLTTVQNGHGDRVMRNLVRDNASRPVSAIMGTLIAAGEVTIAEQDAAYAFRGGDLFAPWPLNMFPNIRYGYMRLALLQAIDGFYSLQATGYMEQKSLRRFLYAARRRFRQRCNLRRDCRRNPDVPGRNMLNVFN